MTRCERTLGTAATLVLAVTLGGMATAEEANIRSVFEVLDSNGDGVVTRAEFEQNKVKVFFTTLEEMSRDKSLDFEDTRLTREAFDAADNDGDGKLSGAEWVLSDFGQFTTYDPDGNGAITYEEFAEGVRPFLR